MFTSPSLRLAQLMGWISNQTLNTPSFSWTPCITHTHFLCMFGKQQHKKTSVGMFELVHVGKCEGYIALRIHLYKA